MSGPGMRRRTLFAAFLAGFLAAGCAEVSSEKRDQFERAQQIGPYGYQRTVQGHGR